METQSTTEASRKTADKPKRAPVLPGGLPLLGHTVEFVSDAIGLLMRAQREMGEVAAFQIFNRKMVAMFGPEAHEAVFRAPDEQLNPCEPYKIMTPIFGKGLVYDAGPKKMAEQLKMLLPALKDRRMRTYGEAVIHETNQNTSGWGEGGVVDFVEFCRVLTNFTSSRCLLGKEFREGMSDEFAKVYHDLEGGVTPLAYVNAHLPIPRFWKRDKARVKMVDMIARIVGARRKDGRTGEDFLQTLMDSKYSDGESLTEDEITGLLLAGMFAGHHTSSVTTSWALIELLRNPEVMKKAVAEVDRVFGSGRPVSHEALRELTYIENVVKEALRIHPPLFMLVRTVLKPFTYKGYQIPVGTWIVVSPTVSHRIPEVFPEPEAFKPERFTQEDTMHDFAYIAFGGGRHKCLGNAFAILQIKAILALLLGQFEFELYGDKIADDFQGLVVGPKEPCRIHYRKRKDASVTLGMAADLGRAVEPPGAAAPAAVPPPGCPAHAHANGAQAHAAAASAQAQPTAPTTSASAPTLADGMVAHIELDLDLCQGHAVCVGEAPNLFRIDDEGKVALTEVALNGILAEQLELAQAAARYCPTKTIQVVLRKDS